MEVEFTGEQLTVRRVGVFDQQPFFTSHGENVVFRQR